MKKLARQHPGWIIHRHAVPHAPHVSPEIRPEGLVRTGPPVMHWHGTGPQPELPNQGYKVLKHGSKAWKEHVEKINADTSGREPDTEHEFCEEPHTHENLAKYVFPTAERVDCEWWHDHSAKQYTQNPEVLERHLEKHHKGEVVTRENGKHLHTRRDKSKESLARRLDVHPMAAPLFEDAEVVYFGLEGCLKADAILSAILREGRKESVFSVPSVSLWAAEELYGFLPFLRGKLVVIVPDGDWFTNREVIKHARFAQRYLQHRDIDAVVAAPSQASKMKGVDDFLGAGHSLDELEVLDREPSAKISQAVNLFSDVVRADGLRNMRRMVSDLAFFADEHGHVHVAQRTMARVLGVSRGAVRNSLDKLREFGFIRTEQLRGGEWLPTGDIRFKTGYVDHYGNYWHGPEEFAYGTRVRVDTSLRCKDLEPRLLGKVRQG